jgi:sec-independent protein translocase protein TatA
VLGQQWRFEVPFSAGHLWLAAIVLVIVLIIWGPGKLPDIGSAMGRGLREFRKASSDTKEQFTNAAKPEAEPEQAAPPSEENKDLK